MEHTKSHKYHDILELYPLNNIIPKNVLFYMLESGKLWPSFSSNSCGSPPKELISSTRNCNVHNGKSFRGILAFFRFAKVSHWLPEFQYKYTPYGAV